ncbi:MAG: hypothetical protein ACTHJ0_04250, partial [Flavipsychrobacter sp.]
VNIMPVDSPQVINKAITLPREDVNNQGNLEMVDDLPHLNDLEMTREFSEAEWIAIYAFYISNYGQKTFTVEEVRQRYYASRKTDNRAKNYNREWTKAFRNFFSTVKDGEYKFKHDGTEKINAFIKGEKSNEIIERNTKKGKRIKKATSLTPAKSIEIAEFDLFKDENKESLEELFIRKKPRNTGEKILTIAYYISKVNNDNIFNEGNIEYAYKALQLKDRPNHLRQTIINIKNKKGWFKEHSSGAWTLERLGETFVDKMPISKNE